MSEEESLGRSRGREELREKEARLGLGVEIKILMKEIFINKKKNVMFTTFLQQIISDRLLLVVTIGLKK